MDKAKHKARLCFSKKLLIADYVILGLLFLAFFVPSIDKASLAMIVVAWIAQVGISTAAYYWKAKAENLVKLPVVLLDDIPEDMKGRVDPNQIIASVLGIGTHN